MSNAGQAQAPTGIERSSDVETARLALDSVWRELAPIVDEARRLNLDASRNPSRLRDPWVQAHTRWINLFDREIKAVEDVYAAGLKGGRLSVESVRAAQATAEKLLGFVTAARERLSRSGVEIATEAVRRLNDSTNERRQRRGEALIDLLSPIDDVDVAIRDAVGKQADAAGLDDAATVATLGVRLRDAGQNAQARPLLEAAADAGDAIAANTLGLILKEAGERDNALRRFQEGAASEDSQALYNLGLMHVEDNEPETARRWLAKSTDPRAAELLSRLPS
jgi:tetratricopeptide (TPR) repeat protein